jgi:hypothetical protein
MGVDKIASGLAKAHQLLQQNPAQAKKAWGTGLCNYMLKKGVLNNEEQARCYGNVQNANIPDPVPKRPLGQTKINNPNSWKGGAPTQAAWVQYGKKGGEYSKSEEGKRSIAEGQKVFVLTGQSNDNRKDEIWRNASGYETSDIKKARKA